jgi:clan AA aspartic protease (TIGR02281 family)
MKHLIAGIALLILAVQPAAAESVQLEEFNGVYMVPVRINDVIAIPFVLDSGASEISVTEDVFKTLMRTRTVTESDFLPPGKYVLADGTERLERRFILHELRVGDQIVRNVAAAVAPDKADPLLGQSFLNQLPNWKMDNTQHAIVFDNVSSPPSHVLAVGAALISSLREQLYRTEGLIPGNAMHWQRGAVDK